MNKKYKMTLYACYLGYVVQGIINNINPILFANYQRSLGITVDKIGILIAVNFVTQIIIDFASVGYVDRIGYRKCMVLANACSVLGLLGVGSFPFWFGDPMLGLTAATILNGIGGGLLEVLVSPIVEAVPTDNKEKSMSMLHSFYCWGCVGFIAVSTLILFVLGTQRWNFLPFVWVLVPFVCGILFCRVPVNRLVEEEERIPVKSLAGQKIFWCLLVLMICAGASEMGMSQWTSYFAEMGLHVNKAVGDLLGACSFCVLMGLARLYYGKSSGDLPIRKFMAGSYVLCIFSYVLTVFAPHPLLGLLGCALCGLSVGVLWPGTFSMAARECRAGGTALFALLALAGDIGCVTGPAAVSRTAGIFPQYGIKAGLLAAVVFPAAGLVLTVCCRESHDPGNHYTSDENR